MLHEQELQSVKFYSESSQETSGDEPSPHDQSFLQKALRWATESKLLLIALVGVPLVGLIVIGALGGSDRAKFDRLSIGMSRAEVQVIVSPKTGKWAHHMRDLDDNVNLTINNSMVLTIRGGRLVDKQWIGKQVSPSRSERRSGAEPIDECRTLIVTSRIGRKPDAGPVRCRGTPARLPPPAPAFP